ncbi:hypothetical protein [Alteromonas sp. a30]|uniref:hypothetical protein n=1 Tax=Alteromonas sp. a30 TaxID=2730917 RepID=UPI002281C69C|nr:hypothetical protein [Alteromonas sp. a30]MCY7294205.1 hypothetical protein [Alteromonas sp. a30]
MSDTYASIPLEFDALKATALQDAEQLASTTWTDHSTSDPGVTILEQCIAQFLRLGNKLNLPLADLLQSRGNIVEPLPDLAFPAAQTVPNQFFTADEALTTAPVSINDRRRILLDHPLVANVQVEPVIANENPLYWNAATQDFTFDELQGEHEITLSGRYRALVELVPNHQLDSGERFELSQALLAQLKQQRNLSEQWQEVILLEPEFVKIKGGISLKASADVEQTLIDIHEAISHYINPPLRAQNKADLLAQGLSSNEIYQGPKLENGFYSESSLNNIAIREEIRVSDLIRIILDFEQVEVVHSLLLSNFANPRDDDWRQWVLPISSGRVPRLEPILTVVDDGDDASSENIKVEGFIDCFKQNVLCEVDSQVLSTKLQEKAERQRALKQSVEWRDVTLPKGTATDLSYRSLQQDFPVVYGLADNQLPDSVGPARLAQVKQLQGYLLLFDQIIANYHQQLANMGELLNSKQRPLRTYQEGEFSATDMDVLTLDDYWSQIKRLVESELTTLPHEQHAQRENRLLDHLFSRLGEAFNDHSSLGFSFGTDGFLQYLQSKQACLAQLAELGQTRFLGADYAAPLQNQQQDQPQNPQQNHNPKTVSGAERRIHAFCGLTTDEQNAFVMVERALLYPKTTADLPSIQRHATLRAELRKDGNYYTILQAPEHGLQEGDVISVFGAAFAGVADAKGNVEALEGASPDANFANTLDEQYTGAYAVRVMDKHTLELALDLKLNPENRQIRFVFDARWVRGLHYTNPYAMQVDVVINKDVGRLAQTGFRQVLLNQIRQELPAHIAPHIHWLSDEQWPTFKGLYDTWRSAYQAMLTNDVSQAGENESSENEANENSLNAKVDAAANPLLAHLV